MDFKSFKFSTKNTQNDLIFVGYQFLCFRGGPKPRIPVATKLQFSVWIMKENIMATNFEPNECVILVQSMKIGTHKNKAIHSNQLIIVNSS